MKIISTAGSVYIVFLILFSLSFILFYFTEKFVIYRKKNNLYSKKIPLFLFYSLIISSILAFYIYIDQNICHIREIIKGSPHCSETSVHMTLAAILGKANLPVFILKIIASVFLLITFIKIIIPLISTQKYYHLFLKKNSPGPDLFQELCNSISIRMRRNIEYRVLDVPVNYAGVIGFLRPAVIIPEKLIKELSEDELKSFMYHEAAHIVNRDNIIRLIILICKSIFFFLPLNSFYKNWDRERDMECDRIASFHTKNPLSVASAILKVTKMSLSNEKKPIYGFSAFSNKKNSFVKIRMEKLISYSQKKFYKKNQNDCSKKDILTFLSLESKPLTAIPLILIFTFFYTEVFFHCFMEILINIHI